MTIWIVHIKLSPDEEVHIGERSHLPLPFGDLPDLSGVSSPAQARQVIRNLYHDDPPESHSRRFDSFWNAFSGLQREDIIVVPLPIANELAFAEVMEPYSYSASEGHRAQVTWYRLRVTGRKLGKYKDVFAEGSIKIFEVKDVETKNAIRGWLSHSHQKFGWMKWLIIIYPLMKLLTYYQKHYPN
jgi:predicted Mrr-cat superfamily restriction endonuclease